MMKKMTTFVLAMMAAQTLSAQEVLTTQQDSLLQVMNDTAYWKSFELGEVVVKSNLPKTRVKGDAMRTLISGSILEKAGSATDALAKIPSLKAEKGSGVEVFGRGAAEIYINGRKVQDMNELDRLRSEDILHVDVVQNPGARYAASTKAVVRIATKKRQGEGFSFVENAGGIYRYGWAGTNNLDVNYRTGGLDITASIWGGIYGHNRGNQSNDITYIIGNDHYLGSSTQDAKNRWSGYSPQIQVNYMLNENHSFGAYYKWDHSTHNKRKGWFLMQNFKNGNPTEDMLSNLDGDGNSRKHIFNAYYNGKVGNLSIDWNIDGLFMNGNDFQTTVEKTTYHDGRPQTQNTVSYSTPSSNDFWATKLILSYPIWQGNLSAGTEYSHTSRNSRYNLNSESAVAVTSSDTDIKESSTSAFVEYGRSFGRLFAQVGLRYEYLRTAPPSLPQGEEQFNTLAIDGSNVMKDTSPWGRQGGAWSYGDWFPTLTLSYRTNSNVQLSLSYRKDIDRPNYDNLSSSIIYINKYSYQSGNPYLKPIYTDNIVLNAAHKWMNASVTFQRIKNDIVLQTMPYYSLEQQGALHSETSPKPLRGRAGGEADPMVSLIRPENSKDSYNRLMFILSGRPQIGIWHPMWQASLVLQNYKSLTLDGSMITLNRPYVWAGWNNDFVLPHDWRINANVNITTKGDYMTYRMTRNTVNTNLGIQKDLNTRSLGKFTFDFRCYDPFNIQKTSNIVFGIRQIESCSKAMRTFTLDITWRFNEAQKKYRGTGAGESQKKRI